MVEKARFISGSSISLLLSAFWGLLSHLEAQIIILATEHLKRFEGISSPQ